MYSMHILERLQNTIACNSPIIDKALTVRLSTPQKYFRKYNTCNNVNNVIFVHNKMFFEDVGVVTVNDNLE